MSPAPSIHDAPASDNLCDRRDAALRAWATNVSSNLNVLQTQVKGIEAALQQQKKSYRKAAAFATPIIVLLFASLLYIYLSSRIIVLFD